MLNPSKKTKLLTAVKAYGKKFLSNKSMELDESGTRLMINSFLTDVLGYEPIEEVKTEYMIRGTYADYVVQIKGVQHFLVEVKALSLQLSANHLRQATNYGANEGIDFILLTNGKSFDFYKVLFNQPIEIKKIFSIDLSTTDSVRQSIDYLQFLHRDSVTHKGLDFLWNKTMALNPEYIAGLLYDPKVINFVKKTLKDKFKSKFTDEEIHNSINTIITEATPIEKIKVPRVRKISKVKK
jgi:hypothetical protein